MKNLRGNRVQRYYMATLFMKDIFSYFLIWVEVIGEYSHSTTVL